MRLTFYTDHRSIVAEALGCHKMTRVDGRFEVSHPVGHFQLMINRLLERNFDKAAIQAAHILRDAAAAAGGNARVSVTNMKSICLEASMSADDTPVEIFLMGGSKERVVVRIEVDDANTKYLTRVLATLDDVAPDPDFPVWLDGEKMSASQAVAKVANANLSTMTKSC